jgi:hypothetical protein
MAEAAVEREASTEAVVEGEAAVEASAEAVVEGETAVEASAEAVVEGETAVEASAEAAVEGKAAVEASAEAAVGGKAAVEPSAEAAAVGKGSTEAAPATMRHTRSSTANGRRIQRRSRHGDHHGDHANRNFANHCAHSIYPLSTPAFGNSTEQFPLSCSLRHSRPGVPASETEIEVSQLSVCSGPSGTCQKARVYRPVANDRVTRPRATDGPVFAGADSTLRGCAHGRLRMTA